METDVYDMFLGPRKFYETRIDDILMIFDVRGFGNRAKVEIWKFFVCFQNTHCVFLEKTEVSCVVRRHNRGIRGIPGHPGGFWVFLGENDDL